MLSRPKRLFTPEEYLVIEERSMDTKSEYYDGVIYSMTGGSINHARIVRNLTSEIDRQLEGSECEVFNTDVRLLVEKHTLFTYPDILVVCGKLPFMPGRTDTLTDAKLIIEVLSPSTARYDRGEKFQFYLGLPSLESYVTVSQDEHRAECHSRCEGGWNMAELTGAAESLRIPTMGLSIPIERIYRGVEFAG